ncbi:MAG TPA: hypothetical protein VNI01_13740, partial [Elusimicrobiota bacterium]|nr:hypothetical protein [Elusimicrobiota bacterium]
FGWRDKLPAAWASAPLALDGSEAPWGEAAEVEEPQLDLRALNGPAALYLRLVSDGEDGRSLLGGRFGQDLTVWFLGADGKTRDWGVRVPLRGRDAPGARDPGAPAELPRFEAAVVRSSGAASSAEPLPSGVRVTMSLSGRERILELEVPLSALAVKDGKSLLADLVTSRSARAETPEPEWRPGQAEEPRKEGARGRGERRRLDGGPRALSAPDPLEIRLLVRLARDPGR